MQIKKTIIPATKSIYSYVFIVKLYNIGNKIGFLQANIEFVRYHTDLKDEFIYYLRSLNL
ncbi:hypothetical protein GCM10008904_04220 [Paraclostridium ghonii]